MKRSWRPSHAMIAQALSRRAQGDTSIHLAMAFSGRTCIATAWNDRSEHAEVKLIMRLKKLCRYPRRGFSMLVVRFSNAALSRGEIAFKLSKPCRACQIYIHNSGLYFKNVFFSVN